MRSGLTSTKPESLRLKVPWAAEKICIWDTQGPLAKPGRELEVPWAGQRVGVENSQVSKEFDALIGDEPIRAGRGDRTIWGPLCC